MMLMQIWKRYETFLRYALVGASGTLVDLLTLYALTEWSGINPKTSLWFSLFVSIAFLAAVIHNYVLNRLWTFKSRDQNVKAQFTRFLVVSLGGFLLTQALMWLLVPVLGVWYLLAKGLTSLSVLIWNFGLNRLWTFRQPPAPEQAPTDPPVASTVSSC
ncbi:MAG: GtrA family protein [Candidatus Melainabacteria bacterium HGW-Melainabacteria-1]|nr:MAG: GtrA family protein [Candidatus Melainabacteria bacterium HGW-Melainabacteria-1]